MIFMCIKNIRTAINNEKFINQIKMNALLMNEKKHQS